MRAAACAPVSNRGAMSLIPDPSSALPPALSPALLDAWLAQSHDLLALTDAAGRVRWANAAFASAAGLAPDDNLAALAPPDWQQGRPLARLQSALRDGAIAAIELCLRGPAGAALWVSARIARVGPDWLWTLQDVTATRELAARAQHQAELLEMAQEFGRLGIWERDIVSGKGRWDRHVFGFWGLPPADSPPEHDDALRQLHPEDELASVHEASIKQAGRYAHRYRVVQPDGSVRWLHSQWEVKNSPEGQPDRILGIIMDDTEAYDLAFSRNSTTAHMKLAVELANLLIWRHDLKTGRLYFDDRGYRTLGMATPPDGLSLKETRDRIHPDDVKKLERSAQLALETGKPNDVQARYRHEDGSWRDLLSRRVVERDARGEPIAFLGVALDVTEQAEQARTARRLAQRLEDAAKAARVGIWTTAFDTIETGWNAQMYELFDMVGAAQPPTLAEWLSRCVHPDDVERVGEAARDYLRNDLGSTEIEFRSVMRDGRVRWMVLRADLDRSSPERPRILGIAMDVTDRHDAQAALHAASERAALIARNAGIGTWETDDSGAPAIWDDQMFRLRGLEPRGNALDRDERLALVHPDDIALVLDSNPKLSTDSVATAYEFRVRWPDGSYRWLASRSGPLRDASGQVVRRVGVNWDITEAKNADLARQQALLAERESRAKSQFLSRMSHELRTPLNAVLGFTQLLQLDARNRPDGAQLAKLNHIRSAGEHLLTLINDALDLSSLEAGTLKLDLQPVSMALAVARALPLVEESAAARQVTIRTAQLDGVAQADSTRLHQVLLNLLSNAIKYNRAGGNVLMEAMRVGQHTVLRVTDTGRGMRPEQLAHLFEPFNRLGIEGEGIEGSGIGMTISRALVEGMGGRIAVSSQTGRGTEIQITLPRAQLDVSDSDWLDGLSGHDAQVDAPAGRGLRTHSGQVLYIEDNAVNVLLVEELVTSLTGLQLATEPTGASGVARARALRPDLILVDMQLPDFDGFEVLRQLRSHPETAGIRCIALSANAMPDDIARGLGGGFDDYWTKPIRFKPFLDALERMFPGAPR